MSNLTGVPPVTVQMVTLLESDLPKMICSGPVSRRTMFSLRVDGPFSFKNAPRLLAIIKANLDMLDHYEDGEQPGESR